MITLTKEEYETALARLKEANELMTMFMWRTTVSDGGPDVIPPSSPPQEEKEGDKELLGLHHRQHHHHHQAHHNPSQPPQGPHHLLPGHETVAHKGGALGHHGSEPTHSSGISTATNRAKGGKK